MHWTCAQAHNTGLVDNDLKCILTHTYTHTHAHTLTHTHKRAGKRASEEQQLAVTETEILQRQIDAKVYSCVFVYGCVHVWCVGMMYERRDVKSSHITPTRAAICKVHTLRWCDVWVLCVAHVVCLVCFTCGVSGVSLMWCVAYVVCRSCSVSVVCRSCGVSSVFLMWCVWSGADVVCCVCGVSRMWCVAHVVSLWCVTHVVCRSCGVCGVSVVCLWCICGVWCINRSGVHTGVCGEGGDDLEISIVTPTPNAGALQVWLHHVMSSAGLRSAVISNESWHPLFVVFMSGVSCVMCDTPPDPINHAKIF